MSLSLRKCQNTPTYIPSARSMSSAPRRTGSIIGELNDFDRAYDRAFALVAFCMNRHLVDHMVRVGRQLTQNDYECMVIWAVLAHQNVAHLLPPGSLPSIILDDRGRVPSTASGLRPLRLRDIVQITGIPRETIRRKLKKLEAERWIVQVESGWVVSRERIEPDLREFSRESVRRFLLTADDVMRALREADCTPSDSEPADTRIAAVAPQPASSRERVAGNRSSLPVKRPAATRDE